MDTEPREDQVSNMGKKVDYFYIVFLTKFFPCKSESLGQLYTLQVLQGKTRCRSPDLKSHSPKNCQTQNQFLGLRVSELCFNLVAYTGL